MPTCPHCQTPLPDPPPAQCPNCGGVVSLAVAPPPLPQVPSAAPGAPPLPDSGPRFEGPAATATPWDERDRIGLAAAFVETTRQVLMEPTAFFRSMRVVGGLGSPLVYGVAIGWLGLVAAAFYQAIWGSIVGPGFVPFAPEGVHLPELVDS